MDVRIPGEVTAKMREEVGDGSDDGFYTNGEPCFLATSVRTSIHATPSRITGGLASLSCSRASSGEAEEVFRSGKSEYIVYGLAEAIVYQYVEKPLGGFFFFVDASVNPDAKEVQERLTVFVDAKRNVSLGEGRERVDDLQELFLA